MRHATRPSLRSKKNPHRRSRWLRIEGRRTSLRKHHTPSAHPVLLAPGISRARAFSRGAASVWEACPAHWRSCESGTAVAWNRGKLLRGLSFPYSSLFIPPGVGCNARKAPFPSGDLPNAASSLCSPNVTESSSAFPRPSESISITDSPPLDSLKLA